MAPLTPHWVQPSHPDRLEVIVNEAAFTSRSISKISLPPFATFAKLSFPPCTVSENVTYATVQMGKDKHLNLNSDLLYINHSCEPSLMFDTSSFNVIVGPKGLEPGDELTFFYPSTEWFMSQPFDCLCGQPTCRGRISGARDMTPEQLKGIWLNAHIRELLEERDAAAAAASSSPSPSSTQTNGASTVANGKNDNNSVKKNGTAAPENGVVAVDHTADALRDALKHAEQVVEAAKTALATYLESRTGSSSYGVAVISSTEATNGNDVANGEPNSKAGVQRRGVTSRELSGEMGGDTPIE